MNRMFKFLMMHSLRKSCFEIITITKVTEGICSVIYVIYVRILDHISKILDADYSFSMQIGFSQNRFSLMRLINVTNTKASSDHGV